jgi:NADH:ubiquinone oxidoreductase subunit
MSLSFLKKRYTTPLGSNYEDKQSTIPIQNATTSKTSIPTSDDAFAFEDTTKIPTSDEYDEFAIGKKQKTSKKATTRKKTPQISTASWSYRKQTAADKAAADKAAADKAAADKAAADKAAADKAAADEAAADEAFSKQLLEEEKKIPRTDFEQEDAFAILDSIKHATTQKEISDAVSKLDPKNLGKMIRYATNEKYNADASPNKKTPNKKTPNKKTPMKNLNKTQMTFLRTLNAKARTENPHTRFIYDDTRDIAELPINWTSGNSSFPRGVIVLVHTHGAFVSSRNVLKYPTNVNNTLESVSSLYLSDIGSTVCHKTKHFENFNTEFLKSFRRVTLEAMTVDDLKIYCDNIKMKIKGLAKMKKDAIIEAILEKEPNSFYESIMIENAAKKGIKIGIKIKDISEKVQEVTKDKKLNLGIKQINFWKKRPGESILERFYEPGVYNILISDKQNGFLNKRYSCGPGVEPDINAGIDDSIQVVYNGVTSPLSTIIKIPDFFDCKKAEYNITTFDLVKKLCEVIPDLKHVLIIDTSCSVFTASVVKELVKKIPSNASPHKQREQGLIKKTHNPKFQTLQTMFEKIYHSKVHGGKKTKKRQDNRHYNKNKSIKRRN